MDLDIIVAGAGPAGCAAAIEARRLGMRTLLLSRPPRPGRIPGETLHPGVDSLFRELGVLPAIERAGFTRHEGHTSEWAGKSTYLAFGSDSSGAWLGYHADRRRLNEILCARAVEMGASLATAVAPELLISRGRVAGAINHHRAHSAKIVIDAAGPDHWSARQLRIPISRESRPLTALYGYASGLAGKLGTPAVLNSSDGDWTWIAEVEPGIYAWTQVSATAEVRPRDWKPRELHGLKAVQPWRAAGVTWRIASRTAEPGLLMAGDAAAVLDPLSSHGVMRALATGIQAARTASRILDRPAEEAMILAEYHEFIAGWFEADRARLAAAYGEAWSTAVLR